MKNTRPKLSATQTQRKQTHARATIALTLSIWLTSCATTRTNNPVPRILPPDPYNAAGELVIKYIDEGETVTAQEDGVLMPYWYYEKIFDYIVDTQAAQEIAAGNKTTPKK